MSLRSLNISVDREGRDRDRHLRCVDKLGKILNLVQSEDSYLVIGGEKKREKAKAAVMIQTEKIYKEFGLKMFSETLYRLMVIPFQQKENIYVTRCIKYFFDLVCDERWNTEGNNEETENARIGMMNDTLNSTVSMSDEGAAENLPFRILRLCEKYHSEQRCLIRQRLMETVAKIIPGVIPVTAIRKSLQVKLIKMLLSRIVDKSDQVRAIAARNLCMFYGEENIPYEGLVLDTLIRHMSTDPEPSVRAQIVTHLSLEDVNSTLEHIVERTGDPSPLVRAAALVRASNSIPLPHLNSEMREGILKANTTEDCPKNVRDALYALLESWLHSLNNDPSELLRILSVRVRPKICRIALNVLYKQTDQEAFDKMKCPLLNDKKFPEDSLCVEGTFLWLYMFERFHNEPYVFNKLSFPATEMIDYITEFIDVIDEEGDLSQDEWAYRSYMLGDLLQILSYLITEEGERQAVLEFLPSIFLKKKLMDERNSILGVKLINQCHNLNDEGNTHLIDLVNAVLDSDRPSTTNSRTTTENGDSRRRTSASLKSDPEGDIGEAALELGSLIHKRKKLERDQIVAITEKDMIKAQQCQDEMRDLDTQIKRTKDIIARQNANQTQIPSSDSQDEEEEPWIYSDKSLLIAISAAKANMIITNRVSNFSRTFYEMYVMKAVTKCVVPTVRALALEFMCFVALDFEEEAPRATLFCLMALLRDRSPVRETALKCMYDLVLRYSFTKLGECEEVQQVLMGISADNLDVNPNASKLLVADSPENTATVLKSLLLSYIRHEDNKLVRISVAGVLKLLFKHELNSTRIMTMFLMNWAIPIYETKVRFKDVAVLIPIYAGLGESEAIEVANCLLQCVKKIQIRIHSRKSLDNSDALPPPGIDKIAAMVVKCTDPARLGSFQRPYIAHLTIAKGALEELKKDLTVEEKMEYAKLLKILDLNNCPVDSIQQLHDTLAEINEYASKAFRNTLAGFTKYLDSLMTEGSGITQSRASNEVDDGTNITTPPGAFDSDQEGEAMETD